jgi:hypothetical protein
MEKTFHDYIIFPVKCSAQQKDAVGDIYVQVFDG